MISRQLTPHLYLLQTPVSNAYLWVDADGITLVDTGPPGTGSLILKTIDDLGFKPTDLRQIVLTHYHLDHIGGTPEITSKHTVPILAHEADVPIIEGGKPAPSPNLTEWERPIFEKAMEHVPRDLRLKFQVDRALNGNDVIEFGDGARIIETPGHTAGSIVVYLPKYATLLTGDTLARGHTGEVIPGVFNVNRDSLKESVKQLANLSVETIGFGHGEPIVEKAGHVLKTAVASM